MKRLEAAIKARVDFPASDLARLKEEFVEKKLPKGELLLPMGKVCRSLFFIEEGLARSFYYGDSGTDVSLWFFREGEFLTNSESFFQQKPSIYNIELLEDARLYEISHQRLEQLFEELHLIERFGRLLAIEMLGEMIQRWHAMQFKSAKERYDFMLERYPDLFQRLRLGDIASFLGIRPETLSRIRAKH
ncbi:Crp/Fnr family transcriptional regulator [Saprospira grandis]|nr:Crp/Fnr family transcriptional regulator [Saprospira grandis]WBM74909.1 Crp/Fnr family transcriptional regulator [Saprospira grandis]